MKNKLSEEEVRAVSFAIILIEKLSTEETSRQASI